MLTFEAVIQWISLGSQVYARGAEAWARIKAALAAEGIQGDTDQLDAVIADAERRGALARKEAGGPL